MAARVTLSFDNGPTPGVTERVLDVLAARGITTTFFVIGEKVAAGGAQAALVDRMVADGHWVGNHTYTHRGLMAALPEADAAEREIGRTQALIARHAHPDRFYRPCGGGGRLEPGLLTPAAVELLIRERYSLVLWNAVPRDWVDPDGWPERAMSMIDAHQATAEDWPLVVLHDVANAALARLADFLDHVAARGICVEQAFPPACVPILRGTVTGDIAGYLA